MKVKFLQPDEHIRPEMNARVTFFDSEEKSRSAKTEQGKLFVIPKRAVVERESGKAVLVVHNGRVEEQPITVQKEVATDVFVSAGLTGTEAIIVGEQLSQLAVGDRVEAK